MNNNWDCNILIRIGVLKTFELGKALDLRYWMSNKTARFHIATKWTRLLGHTACLTLPKTNLVWLYTPRSETLFCIMINPVNMFSVSQNKDMSPVQSVLIKQIDLSDLYTWLSLLWICIWLDPDPKHCSAA